MKQVCIKLKEKIHHCTTEWTQKELSTTIHSKRFKFIRNLYSEHEWKKNIPIHIFRSQILIKKGHEHAVK